VHTRRFATRGGSGRLGVAVSGRADPDDADPGPTDIRLHDRVDTDQAVPTRGGGGLLGVAVSDRTDPDDADPGPTDIRLHDRVDTDQAVPTRSVATRGGSG